MSKEEIRILCEKKNPLTFKTTVFHSITDFDLSEKERKKALVELGETEDKKRECLKELKDKLSEDKNVHYWTDDAYLLRYLRTRKFDCKKAYSCLKQFYHLKKTRTDFFHVPPRFKLLLDNGFIRILPYSDEEGRIIIWLDMGNWKLEEMSFDDGTGVGMIISDLISMNPRCQVNGIISIWDMKGFSRSHFKEYLRKQRLQTLSSLLQVGYPWRVKKLICVNANWLVRLIFNIVRPFVTSKILSRIVLLGSDVKELHEHVSPAILPKTLGGELEDLDCSVTDFVLGNLPFLEYVRSFY